MRELRARVDLPELAEWQAFDRLEPLGMGRLNLMLASLSAMTANIHRDPSKQASPFDPDDFLPFHVPSAPAGEAAQNALEARMKAFFQARSNVQQ